MASMTKTEPAGKSSPHVVLREPEDMRFVVLESGDTFELIVTDGERFVGYTLGFANARRLLWWLLCRYVVSLFGLRIWWMRREQRRLNHAPP